MTWIESCEENAATAAKTPACPQCKFRYIVKAKRTPLLRWFNKGYSYVTSGYRIAGIGCASTIGSLNPSLIFECYYSRCRESGLGRRYVRRSNHADFPWRAGVFDILWKQRPRLGFPLHRLHICLDLPSPLRYFPFRQFCVCEWILLVYGHPIC